MKDVKLLVAIGGTVLCLVACTSSQTLTRGKATDILEKSPAYQPQPNAPVYLTREQHEEGVKEGLWTKEDDHLHPVWWKLTPSGERCFTGPASVSDLMRNPKLFRSFIARFNFKRKVIEITGITDDSAAIGDPTTTKVVDVKWTYDFAGCPDDIRIGKVFKDYSKEDQDMFKLYDDGWRYVRVVGSTEGRD